ncbi:hypothetical protein [Stieleria varia]|nr:hypothetical protein [Stieleria varia]
MPNASPRPQYQTSAVDAVEDRSQSIQIVIAEPVDKRLILPDL